MQPTFKGIPLDNIHPGPIRHNKLPEHLVERIERFYEKISEVDDDPLEKVIDSFRRDVHPEREVAVWEHIAAGYQDIISRHPSLPLAALTLILVWKHFCELRSGLSEAYIRPPRLDAYL